VTHTNWYVRGRIATRTATITGQLVADRGRINRRYGRYDSSAEITEQAHEYLGQGDGQASAVVWATVAQIHATSPSLLPPRSGRPLKPAGRCRWHQVLGQRPLDTPVVVCAAPLPHRTDCCRSIRRRGGVKGGLACTFARNFDLCS
jgi:hypothetical protein